MPSVQFVCPHCEKQSEVQVASVTRSRLCPHCGYSVLIQVGGKNHKSTRRALLVNASKDAPAKVHVPGSPAYAPKPLEGDVFERMGADPEIQAIRKQLLGGLSLLGILIVAAIAWHYVPIDAPPQLSSAPSPESSSSLSTAPRPAATSSQSAPPSLSAMAQRVSRQGAASSLRFMASSGAVNAPAVGVNNEKTLQAKKVLAAFLAADTVDALLPTIANRSAVEARLLDYYQNRPLIPVRAIDILAVENMNVPATAIAMQVTLSSGRQLQAAVLAMDDRHLGVDWPSFVALSDMEWSQFLASKPTTSTQFRLLVEPDKVYTGSFADAQTWQCFKLTHPSDPTSEAFFAYAERKSTLGQEITAFLRNRSSPMPVTVRLRFPNNGETGNQCFIDALVSSSWVVPESDQAR